MDELLCQWVSQSAHILCITEHHLNKNEIRISINNYNLGIYYCRKAMKNCGVDIFIHQSLQYTPFNLEEFCIDQVVEVCAMKLYQPSNNICI
jgi:hypothetical protein